MSKLSDQNNYKLPLRTLSQFEVLIAKISYETIVILYATGFSHKFLIFKVPV